MHKVDVKQELKQAGSRFTYIYPNYGGISCYIEEASI